MLRIVLFDILAVAIHAFPEPYTGILWEAVESLISEVVESTCLGFLNVLRIEDLLEYLSPKPV